MPRLNPSQRQTRENFVTFGLWLVSVGLPVVAMFLFK